MPEYRHYQFDGAGNITSAEWIVAEEDSEAITQAGDAASGIRSEIWQGDRLVARIGGNEPD
jgi:hypothetical protein